MLRLCRPRRINDQSDQRRRGGEIGGDEDGRMRVERAKKESGGEGGGYRN